MLKRLLVKKYIKLLILIKGEENLQTKRIFEYLKPRNFKRSLIFETKKQKQHHSSDNFIFFRTIKARDSYPKNFDQYKNIYLIVDLNNSERLLS